MPGDDATEQDRAVRVARAGEYRIALPARCAHPHDLAPGADDGPALPISEQCIVTQGMRGHRLKAFLRAAAHVVRLPRFSPGLPVTR